jgi:hypothetical protein
LTPRKAKTLIPKTAEQSGFPEETCSKVILYFYKVLRERLSSLEYKKILVDNFGAFYCKERALESFRRRYEIILERIAKYPEGPRKERVTRWATEELAKVLTIQGQYKEDKERRQFFMLHKETLQNEQDQENLEDQKGDN